MTCHEQLRYAMKALAFIEAGGGYTYPRPESTLRRWAGEALAHIRQGCAGCEDCRDCASPPPVSP